MKMVAHALKELGKRAMPLDIQEFVLRTYGVLLTRNLINGYKHTLLKGKKKGKGKRGGREAAAASPVASQTSNGSANVKVTMDDLQTIQALTKRVGPSQLRSLIDMLAK
jgi:hypothetical protein